VLFELETTAMRYRVVRMKRISREFVRANRDRIFLFGDNLFGQGFGGQAAAMRGEPNCVGIPTKKFPSSRHGAFFTDLYLSKTKRRLTMHSTFYFTKFRRLNRPLLFLRMASGRDGLNLRAGHRKRSPIYKSV